MSWPARPISDVCSHAVDCVNRTAPVVEYETPYKMLRTTNVKGGFVDTDNVRYVTLETYERWTRRLVPQRGDVFLTREAPLGDVGRLTSDDKVFLGQRLFHYRANPGIMDARFLAYVLQSPSVQGWIKGLGMGATVEHARVGDFHKIPIPTPPLDVQIRIGSILSAYEDLIENNRRRIALLEEAAQMLYREWFVRFRFPGHEHVRIVDGIPDGWERRYLGDVVTTQYGYTASASEEEIGPKFLRGTDINKRSFIDWSAVPYCPDQGLDFEKFALEPGDILVIRMADPGRVALVEKQIRAVFASYLVRLKIRDPHELPPVFIFMTLADDRYQGFISSSSGGATRKSASAKLLTDFHFALPPKVLLNLFVEQVSPMREMITKLVDQAASAAQARDLLLPRLMNGKIAV